jgi:hypothetical protein
LRGRVEPTTFSTLMQMFQADVVTITNGFVRAAAAIAVSCASASMLVTLPGSGTVV